MPFSLAILTESAILASSLSLDAFTAGFAYGNKKIKISILSVLIISLICCLATGLALIMGSVLKPYFPERLADIICFIILFVIGIVKLMDSITKSIIRKHNILNREIKFSAFNFKFILNLYANPEDADIDESKTLSAAESATIAIALSLDGVAIGFGAALGSVNGPSVFVISFITNAAAVIIGRLAGEKAANNLPFNISWFSGAVLILLAFLKLF